MASRIAEAYVQIVPRIDGVAAGISNQLGGQMTAAGVLGGKSFGAGLKSAIGPAVAVAGAVAIAGVGKFFSEAIAGASAFEAEFEGVNQVFLENAKEVQDFAATAARTTGLTATSALQAAKTLGIFGKSAGLNTAEAAKFSTSLVQLAGDLGSFNDVPTEEALAAIQSGLMGQAEPLRKFGVFLTDAALRQQALEMGIYNGTGALDSQQKMLAAYNLIMNSTLTQQGDFVNYQDTYGNAIKTISSEFKNAKDTIGLAFLPAVANVAVIIRDKVMPVITDFANRINEVFTPELWEGIFSGESLGNLRQNFMDLILKALPGIIDAIVKFIPIMIQNWASMIISLVNSLVAAMPLLIDGAIQFFTAIVDALVIIIPMLITAIVEAIPQIVDALVRTLPVMIAGAILLFTGLVQGLLEILPVLLKAIIDLIPVVVMALISMLPILITGAIELFLGLVTGLIAALPQIITAIVGAIPLLIRAITDALPALIKGAILLFLGIISGLIQALPQIIGAIINAMPELIQALLDAIPLFIDAGFQLIGGLIQGIIGAIPDLINALGQGIGQAIDAGKALLGIKSPSTVFIGIGKDVVDGMTIGIEKNSADPAKAIRQMANGVTASGEAYASFGMLPSLVSPQSSMSSNNTNGSNQVVNYYAAPNQSIDAERALLQAMQRAKVITGW